ncbi:MAG: DUF4442 domain-containing protein [Erythrobacter sp.]
MSSAQADTKTFSVPFVERTQMRYEAKERGYCRLVMPLGPNANHVDVMYMGAYTVLAEAAAANPGISFIDPAKHFPIIKDIAVDFHRMAASDVSAEFRLSEDEIAALEADLARKGSATYVAEIAMLDADGALAATGKVTVKLLSHKWDG